VCWVACTSNPEHNGRSIPRYVTALLCKHIVQHSPQLSDHTTAAKKKQIGDHALPQRGFGLGTPKGAEGAGATPGNTGRGRQQERAQATVARNSYASAQLYDRQLQGPLRLYAHSSHCNVLRFPVPKLDAIVLAGSSTSPHRTSWTLHPVHRRHKQNMSGCLHVHLKFMIALSVAVQLEILSSCTFSLFLGVVPDLVSFCFRCAIQSPQSPHFLWF
jgi:hypothetical protein